MNPQNPCRHNKKADKASFSCSMGLLHLLLSSGICQKPHVWLVSLYQFISLDFEISQDTVSFIVCHFWRHRPFRLWDSIPYSAQISYYSTHWFWCSMYVKPACVLHPAVMCWTFLGHFCTPCTSAVGWFGYFLACGYALEA